MITENRSEIIWVKKKIFKFLDHNIEKQKHIRCVILCYSLKNFLIARQ